MNECNQEEEEDEENGPALKFSLPQYLSLSVRGGTAGGGNIMALDPSCAKPAATIPIKLN